MMTPEDREALIARVKAAVLAQFGQAAGLMDGALRVNEAVHVTRIEKDDNTTPAGADSAEHVR